MSVPLANGVLLGILDSPPLSHPDPKKEDDQISIFHWKQALMVRKDVPTYLPYFNTTVMKTYLRNHVKHYKMMRQKEKRSRDLISNKRNSKG